MFSLFLSLFSCTQGEMSLDASPSLTSTAHAAETTLPDLSKGLSGGGCDKGPGGAGAASYFYDVIKIANWSDDLASNREMKEATGSEEWIMKANKQWSNSGGSDCSVRWSLQGTTRPPKSCTSCTIGFNLINNLDKVGSTCPKKMAKTNSGESIGYDVLLRADGTATAYFSNSGKKFADGYHKGGEIHLLSDMSCRWF